MKRYNFSQVGGFPLEHERLAWMQEGYINAINAIAQLGNTGVPRAVFGVELTSGSWAAGGTVSDGYIAHPTLGLMPFIGGAFTPTTRGVSYTDITTPLTFGNASNQNVEINRVAQIAPGALWDLKDLSESRWSEGFGLKMRNQWELVNPVSGSGTGQLYFRLDKLTNTVTVYGFANRGNGLPGNVVHFYLPIPIGTIPSGSWHFNTTVGIANGSYPGNSIINSSNNTEIIAGLGAIIPSSILRVWLRWQPTASGYTQYFNFSFPLID